MKFFSKFGRIVGAALCVIGAIPLMIMIIIVTGNSVGRALFRTPITGTIEIAGLAGVIVVAAAVGFTARERANVAVDVLMTRLKPKTKRVFDSVTSALSLGAVLFLLYAVILDAFKSVKLQDVTMTMSIPTSPFKFTWAAGVFILACFLVVHLIRAIRGKDEP
ncbi:MAG TPA: TRAP transporter small permease [Syntrophorhabdaceae bacterium]|nr:TRAP transporter small permease [Syntrophorhabdaceae bacterium]